MNTLCLRLYPYIVEIDDAALEMITTFAVTQKCVRMLSKTETISLAKIHKTVDNLIQLSLASEHKLIQRLLT